MKKICPWACFRGNTVTVVKGRLQNTSVCGIFSTRQCKGVACAPFQISIFLSVFFRFSPLAESRPFWRAGNFSYSRVEKIPHPVGVWQPSFNAIRALIYLGSTTRNLHNAFSFIEIFHREVSRYVPVLLNPPHTFDPAVLINSIKAK